MLIFESDLYTFYAVGAGLAIGLPAYTLTVRLATRGLEKLFPRKRLDKPPPHPLDLEQHQTPRKALQ